MPQLRRVRVIPVLLLSGGGLVKTVRFKKRRYIGDPINAVKIFNDKEVDELVVLDIDATAQNRRPDFAHVKDIVGEAFMPLGYGGGIKNIEDIKQLFDCGIEKVIINTALAQDAKVIGQAAAIFGSQSIVGSVDIGKNWLDKQHICVRGGQKKLSDSVSAYVKKMEEAGIGEIIVTSIDHEGTMAGYHFELIAQVSEMVRVPVVANGGAGGISDFVKAVEHGASAVAAGSMFVYKGAAKGILINYPSQMELIEKFYSKI